MRITVLLGVVLLLIGVGLKAWYNFDYSTPAELKMVGEFAIMSAGVVLFFGGVTLIYRRIRRNPKGCDECDSLKRKLKAVKKERKQLRKQLDALKGSNP